MDVMFRKIASWLFLLGIVIAVIIGAVWAANPILEEQQTVLYPLLAALGFIVGVLTFFAVGNITHEKVPTFLIAALILIMVGAAGKLFENLAIIGPYFSGIATMIAVFIAPAAGLLAIKAIWDAGKSEELQKELSKK